MTDIAAAFTTFGPVYDSLVSDMEYDDWASFIVRQSKLPVPIDSILDLGCGTGNSTRSLEGYATCVIGLDLSPSMLEVARSKHPEIEFVEQDARAFSINRKFSLTASMFDTMNNFLEARDFMAVAQRVLLHLTPGGVFGFDVNTDAFYREFARTGPNSVEHPNGLYKWTPSYDTHARIAQMELEYRGKDGSLRELHVERAYELDEIQAMLQQVGFADVRIIDFPSGTPATSTSHRVWVFGSKRHGESS